MYKWLNVIVVVTKIRSEKLELHGSSYFRHLKCLNVIDILVHLISIIVQVREAVKFGFRYQGET